MIKVLRLLKLDLDRQGSGRTELAIAGSVDFELTGERMAEVSLAGTLLVDNVGSRFLVHGELAACGSTQCSRCLADFELSWDVPVEFLILRDVAGEEADQEALVILQSDGEVDLTPVLRECLILAFPLAPVCRPECRGLCAQCGTDLNEGSCDCAEQEVDPRWEGLP